MQQSVDIDRFNYDIGIEYLGRRNVTGRDARGSVHEHTYSLRKVNQRVLFTC